MDSYDSRSASMLGAKEIKQSLDLRFRSLEAREVEFLQRLKEIAAETKTCPTRLAASTQLRELQGDKGKSLDHLELQETSHISDEDPLSENLNASDIHNESLQFLGSLAADAVLQIERLRTETLIFKALDENSFNFHVATASHCSKCCELKSQFVTYVDASSRDFQNAKNALLASLHEASEKLQRDNADLWKGFRDSAENFTSFSDDALRRIKDVQDSLQILRKTIATTLSNRHETLSIVESDLAWIAQNHPDEASVQYNVALCEKWKEIVSTLQEAVERCQQNKNKDALLDLQILLIESTSLTDRLNMLRVKNESVYNTLMSATRQQSLTVAS